MKIVVNDEDGNVIINKIIKTGHNGFFDIWLSRNETFTINIEYEGKKINKTISTFDDSKTCITDLKLK